MSKESTAFVYLMEVSPKHVISGSVVSIRCCGETLIFFRGIWFKSLFARSGFKAVVEEDSPKILGFFTFPPLLEAVPSFLTNVVFGKIFLPNFDVVVWREPEEISFEMELLELLLLLLLPKLVGPVLALLVTLFSLAISLFSCCGKLPARFVFALDTCEFSCFSYNLLINKFFFSKHTHAEKSVKKDAENQSKKYKQQKKYKKKHIYMTYNYNNKIVNCHFFSFLGNFLTKKWTKLKVIITSLFCLFFLFFFFETTKINNNFFFLFN